jgi:two-component system sensor histidine kinase AlgZ
MRDVSDRLLNFWTLQALGWGVYGLAVFLATVPYLSVRDVVVYRSTFTLSCFGSSLILHVVCRRLWIRRTELARSFLIVLLCSYSLGYVCGAIALAADSRLGMAPMSFSWRASLTGTTPIANGFVLLSWCALYFGIKYYQALEVERQRVLLAEASARDAELRALRYQIHPHFLFNTLNAISSLVIQGHSTAAVTTISRLADFFRATLEEKNVNEVSLKDEMFLTEQYFEIEKTRLGDRLTVNIKLDPAVLPCLVPHLVLQPLVENAIRHGIAPRRGAGQVTIRAERIAARTRITVCDDGLGKSTRPVTEGNSKGIGLTNTDKRLRELYGDDYHFELKWPAEGGCEAVVEVPYRSGNDWLRSR